MTAAGWKRLARRVERRLLAGEPGLDLAAREVLRALLAWEVAPPDRRLSQEAWAGHLDIGVHVLRRALGELRAAGLLLPSTQSGTAPEVYALNAVILGEWVEGRLVLRNSQGYSSENQSANGAQSFENRTAASRAGVNQPQQSQTDRDDLPSQHDFELAVATIRKQCLMKFATGAHPRLRLYMHRGISLADIEELAIVGAERNAMTPMWFFERFEELLRQREEAAGVIRLDDEQEPENVRPFTGELR